MNRKIQAVWILLAFSAFAGAGNLWAGTFDGSGVTRPPVAKTQKIMAAPGSQTVVPEGFHVRVAGYNIAHARGNKSDPKDQLAKMKNLRGIVKLLQDQKIDVVGFSEISKGGFRAEFIDQPEYIAKKLGFHHVYAENVKVGWFGMLATQGNAIVSRYPILGSKNHLLSRSDAKHEQRSCLEATLDLGKGKKLVVMIAHLSLEKDEADRQVEELWGFVEKCADPVILVGDLNSRPTHDRIKKLAERMKDTSANLATTFMNKPGVKIDYQFTHGPIKAGKASVTGFQEGYSDHGCLINDYFISQ